MDQYITESVKETFVNLQLTPIRELGRGQYGIVLLVHRQWDNRKFALKLTRSLHILHFEIDILSRLGSHPAIVTYDSSWSTRDTHGIMLNFVEGPSLLDVLSVQHFSEPVAQRHFRRLAEGIQYAHNVCGIAHRDLKAENIMVTPEGSLTIIDWGMGMRWSPTVRSRTTCGSPEYAAPELYQNLGYHGPELDVWAMGVILYAMVSGNFPFGGHTPAEIACRVCKGVFEMPPHVSQECAGLIRQMLARNASERIVIDQVMAHPWVAGAGAEQSEPPSAQQPSGSVPSSAPSSAITFAPSFVEPPSGQSSGPSATAPSGLSASKPEVSTRARSFRSKWSKRSKHRSHGDIPIK